MNLNKKNINNSKTINKLKNEIVYLKNEIALLKKVKEEQREYIIKNLNIKDMIKDIIEVQPRIEFKSIEGIIQNIRYYKSSTLYADNRPYCRLVYYDIEVLTDDMYTITINPIEEGTIKDMYYKMKNNKNILLNKIQ